MSQFLGDRWNDIAALNSAQWMIVVVLSVAIGTALFYLFNWLYSQRFKAQRDVIDLQKRQLELYAGQPGSPELPAPKDASATPILPDKWSPYLDQALDYLDQELTEWRHGQQGANRLSADIGSVQDAKLLETYVRFYERLPTQKREELRKEQREWLSRRRQQAQAAIESHGGTLAPLEFNTKFIDLTKERIEEIQRRIPAT
jgi:uncharacterized protein YecT (DUF1311 family)